ncbi:ATP-binding protein [Hespellia stercorisuis]|uniref:AAA ATPase domain-containing protein n=1 Tax=Hespellia stercorisuis DSM 15480 TaxID=1121950 RepID=A0A1M6PPP1_9FIRM|nr:ATP-binding protein [Hespellia stercorisuis]SHK09889.1 AAA ATPase domain-containing protein [Hespellia stercorisuis DSM 15480]
MKIHSLVIKNFRGYKGETKVLFDDLTVFVGQNDIGKSTILEALDIFFNNNKGIIKIDPLDVNIFEKEEGNEETIISVTFTDLPDSIVIDSSASTTLEKEYLINEDNQLEVVKKFKSGGSAKVFIKAFHPTHTECADLLLKKNKDLKKIIKDNSIEVENQNVNSIMREAIWKHYSDCLECKSIEIDTSKEDAKNIWEKLNCYMPVYSLFQSDRKNSDGDSEVQDPLQEAVKQILSDEQLLETLNIVAQEVQDKLKEVASRTLDKLREMDPNVANSLNPVIPSTQGLKWQDVFKKVSISGDGDIPINKRGSGVKRLILLNFFRGEVERRLEASDNTGVIYAIEEPETSQHIDNQKKLIVALKSLSEMANVQVVLTTHSSFIVKQLDFSNLRLISKDKESHQKKIDKVLPGQLSYPSLNEVNYIAFDDVTIEYHNELYSYIEYRGWINDYRSKAQNTNRTYNRVMRDGTIKAEQKILSEYIRNLIHHPENRENAAYSHQELNESIVSMRDYIQTKTDETESE